MGSYITAVFPASKAGPMCRLQVSAVIKVKLDPRVCRGLQVVELEFLTRLRTHFVVKVGAKISYQKTSHICKNYEREQSYKPHVSIKGS